MPQSIIFRHPPPLPSSPAGCGLTEVSSIWIARSSRAMTLNRSNPNLHPLSHYPAFSFSVIIRLDRIIHAAEHHFPSSAASSTLTRRMRLDRSIRRNGDGGKEIARSSRAMTLKKSNRETKTKESSRETRKQTGQRQKRRNSPIKTKTPFCSDIPVKPECD